MGRPPTPADPGASGPARDVAQRFDRWFDAHGLDLPQETRAQFVDMGLEAIQRWPDRAPDDVLDELIAELDGRLNRIVDETSARHDALAAQPEAGPRDADAPAAPARGALARLFGRRDRRH